MKAKKIQFSKNYKAQGFVEALVAIAVTGIAGIVLLSIATRTVNQTVYNEIKDEITLENNNMQMKLDFIVEAVNSGDYEGATPLDDMDQYFGQCVFLDVSLDDISSYEITPACPNALSPKGVLPREDCSLSELDGFALVCPTLYTSDVLTVDIISGNSLCDGRKCNDFVNGEAYLLK